MNILIRFFQISSMGIFHLYAFFVFFINISQFSAYECLILFVTFISKHFVWVFMPTVNSTFNFIFGIFIVSIQLCYQALCAHFYSAVSLYLFISLNIMQAMGFFILMDKKNNIKLPDEKKWMMKTLGELNKQQTKIQSVQ